MPATHRRLAVLAGVLVLLALLPATAGAAPLLRRTVPLYALYCDTLTSPTGPASFFAGQEGAEEWASLAVWAPGADPESDLPVIVSVAGTATRDQDAVTGTLELVDANTGDPAGEASFTATIRAIGDPILVTDSSPARSGNVVDRSFRTEWAAEVTGALEVSGGAGYDLGGCQATIGEVREVRNIPAKVVEHLPGQRSGACLVPGPDGSTLALLVLSEHGATFGELAVLWPGEEEPVLFGFGPLEFARTSLAGTVELVSADGAPAGSAQVSATVDWLGPRLVSGREGVLTYRIFVRDFALAGSVVVDGIGVFDLDGACGGAYERGWLQYPNPEA